MSELALLEKIAQIPYWKGAVDIMPLVGGITNRNFVVTDADAEKFVVRIGKSSRERVPCELHLAPQYDPKMERVKV